MKLSICKCTSVPLSLDVCRRANPASATDELTLLRDQPGIHGQPFQRRPHRCFFEGTHSPAADSLKRGAIIQVESAASAEMAILARGSIRGLPEGSATIRPAALCLPPAARSLVSFDNFSTTARVPSRPSRVQPPIRLESGMRTLVPHSRLARISCIFSTSMSIHRLRLASMEGKYRGR